jgi:Uma2 family endonuclease
MASVDAPVRSRFARGRRLYMRAPTPIHFPSEEPLEEQVGETKRHLETRTALYLLLKDALSDATVGSEQFVYYDAGDPRRNLAPDVFVKLGARVDSFDTWKVWQRGAPDLAVEIVSAHDHRDATWDEKMERYQASGIAEVVRFDPDDDEQTVRIWDRVDDELLERAPESGDLRACLALGLWWVVVPSRFGPMLRLARDRAGTDLLPTPDEERTRAKHAAALAEGKLQAAEDEIARLRAELLRARGG